MGNRAVITTEGNLLTNGIGIYLHWNGGRDSVEAFLKYCEMKGFRSPDRDPYGWARLVQIIANYFGGGLSVGVDNVNMLDLDNSDNGTYLIEGWQIVGRRYFTEEYEQDEYELAEMLESIDATQPTEEQIGGDVIRELLRTETEGKEDLIEGDEIALRDGTAFPRFEVKGIGEQSKIVNGTDVSGIPYIDRYFGSIPIEDNINNYLTGDSVWVITKRACRTGGKKIMASNGLYLTIEEHIGTIATYQTGWNKELNIVAWNGGAPKFDIREWSPDHERMTRGITLHEEEARKLMEVLGAHFNERGGNR